MLNFEKQLDKMIIDYFVKYNVNPIDKDKVVIFDAENQIHYTNSLPSSSNLNVVVSKNLVTKAQYTKTSEIINTWQTNQAPFTWVVTSNSQDLQEKDFFVKKGFKHTETIIAMTLDLNQFNQDMPLNDNEKFNHVDTLTDVENFRSVIKSAFSLSLIDLQKYYGLHEMRKTQVVDYQTYLTVADQPVSTGQFYYYDNLAIIDDIATNPKFQRQGFAKKTLHHLLNTAKRMGYQQAALIATPEGFPIYQKLGFKPITLYFDVYELNY